MRELANKEDDKWNDDTRHILKIISDTIIDKANCGLFTAEFKHATYTVNVKWHLIENILKENGYKIEWKEELELTTIVIW